MWGRENTSKTKEWLPSGFPKEKTHHHHSKNRARGQRWKSRQILLNHLNIRLSNHVGYQLKGGDTAVIFMFSGLVYLQRERLTDLVTEWLQTLYYVAKYNKLSRSFNGSEQEPGSILTDTIVQNLMFLLLSLTLNRCEVEVSGHTRFNTKFSIYSADLRYLFNSFFCQRLSTPYRVSVAKMTDMNVSVKASKCIWLWFAKKKLIVDRKWDVSWGL